MKENMEARVLLSSGLILIISLSAAAFLLRGGIRLPSRKIGFGMYIIFILAILLKMIFSTQISSDLMINHMNSLAHISHYMLLMICISLVYFYTYARVSGIWASNIFIGRIWKELSTDTAAEDHQDIGADSCLWSLRLDPLASGRALTDDRLTEAAIALADVIMQHCPSVHAVMRAGTDRIIWLPDPLSQGERLTSGLMRVTQHGHFPDLQMTLGVSAVRGRKLMSVAAEADRRAIFLENRGARISIGASLSG